MWKNICQYIFASLLSKIETSVLLKIYFLYTNHKSQNGKFLWLVKTFVSYYCVPFMASKPKQEVSMPLFMASKTRTASFHDLIRTLFLVLLFRF